ncbi:hypothetical protein HBI38_123710 [Parastagonospora nodorum]|nr:hypothetical protein HBH51_054180 [Parastagonospora nodorum]KAH4047364.1 hypothetical protein HBH49_173190 [Parastagonospora nodorum]KAH4201015.1 hypothetical protein HBH42_023540 [Parastagonospora nodorum]KAH4609768.1 hypothetical protein HBH82_061820 [Parastagonospora nodorum]KAH4691365.1 hypothetical protein HBH78_079160 [Parastagonospora nodorum]
MDIQSPTNVQLCDHLAPSSFNHPGESHRQRQRRRNDWFWHWYRLNNIPHHGSVNRLDKVVKETFSLEFGDGSRHQSGGIFARKHIVQNESLGDMSEIIENR